MRTTALVFAGGGSHGAVEAGMLRALTAHGVTADFVVGSSVGAINAAYYAADPTATGVERLDRIWRGIRRRDVFPVSPVGGLLSLLLGRDHLVAPTGLRRLLEHHLPYRRLEDARIPCHAIATDLLAGTEVRLSTGPAVDALLATTAIPGVFPPVHLDGRWLIDGGVASNTPIAAAVALGATRLIVLPGGTACALAGPPRGIIGTALHALTLLIARQLADDVERFARQAELIVVPPLCPLAVSAYDFSHAAELIDHAAAATAAWLEQGGLRSRSVPGSLRPHAH